MTIKHRGACLSLMIISVSLGLILFLQTGALAEESRGSELVPANQSSMTANNKKEEIKKIEAQTTETKEAIKQITQDIDQGKIEAEKALREKFELEKEAALKEKEASLIKQEAEVLKKVAETKRDPSVAKEAKQVEQKAQVLQKEADVFKERLSVAETRANWVQSKVSSNEEIIKRLQDELESLKRAKISSLGLGHRLARALVSFVCGVIALYLLTFAIQRAKKASHQHSAHLLSKGIVRESETSLRTKTLASLFGWFGYIIVVLMTVYFVLDSMGFDVAPLLAGAGIAGLAFGFGGQYLIRDIISGLFIMLEGQIRVNDVVKIGEFGGLVEDLNLRIVTLRDLEGRVIVIPNGEIKTLVNFTKEYAFALLNLGVAYKENVDQVIQVIKDVGKEIRADKYYKLLIKEDLEMLGVDGFDDSQVTIKFRIKTLPIKQWEVAREFRRRIKNRFDELGIEIPFPHRTLYWGTGKENQWVRDLLEAKQGE